ncbi:putative PIH1 domain-containing protein 2 isoform X3 [Apostichopus japonicus]|uniref:Putative PIH1 domain-containing protein 2 isoform X3 n=1 Tax=Stichopus japonicus TaxID=307972 RepID=A0A2G8KZQ7_STIJA|nr:putative PIH1 domain-containing protein 2 isoform X3 [Apostichopus japonicus]
MDSPNEMLKQAEHIWKMLDELADSDPNAYKNFVQKSMDEKKRETAIPEPFMCLKTELITKTSDNTFLFVNICSWTKVPAPKSSTDAVSVTGGPLEEKQSEYGIVNL